MATVSRDMETSPERVWDVLCDGWLFPLWVVGAARIRDVDRSWPAPGSKIYHSVGTWPFLINDDTEVLQREEGSMLQLRAKGQPLGSARVTLILTPSVKGTEVTIDEVATSGPGTVIPEPVMAPILNWRNVETLRRLAFIAERRPNALLPKEG